jgi:hypothetical protein
VKQGIFGYTLRAILFGEAAQPLNFQAPGLAQIRNFRWVILRTNERNYNGRGDKKRYKTFTPLTSVRVWPWLVTSPVDCKVRDSLSLAKKGRLLRTWREA